MIPRLQVLGDRRYRVEEDFECVWTHEHRKHWLLIPQGTISDGNSVPFFARFLVPGDWTLGVVPVIVHDFLYSRNGRLEPHEYAVEYQPGIWGDPLDRLDGTRTVWTREEADRLFARLMREAGVPRWRRRAAYRGVRLAWWQEWSIQPWEYDDFCT